MAATGLPGTTGASFVVAFALLVGPGGAQAAACPVDADAAAQWLQGQREISRLDPECTVDCTDDRVVEGQGLSVLGVEPRKLRVERGDDGHVVAVAAALPGGFAGHAPAFEAAYLRAPAPGQGQCDELLCGWRSGSTGESATRGLFGADLQPLPFVDDETWLFCWYAPPR